MPQCDSLKRNGCMCSRDASYKVIRRADGYVIEYLCGQHARIVLLTGLADDVAIEPAK